MVTDKGGEATAVHGLHEGGVLRLTDDPRGDQNREHGTRMVGDALPVAAHIAFSEGKARVAGAKFDFGQVDRGGEGSSSEIHPCMMDGSNRSMDRWMDGEIPPKSRWEKA